jgi:1,4-dihydroxy-2-naphthoyl-CoA hydrolase
MLDTRISIDYLNELNKGNLTANLGIEFIEITETSLTARMPVDERTIQPFGIVHGGANAGLGESVGSLAAYLSVDRTQYYTVGQEIKCNHLKPVTGGYVYGTAKALRLGRQTHLWQIEIRDENDSLTAFCTLSMMVLPLTEEMKQIQQQYFF